MIADACPRNALPAQGARRIPKAAKPPRAAQKAVPYGCERNTESFHMDAGKNRSHYDMQTFYFRRLSHLTASLVPRLWKICTSRIRNTTAKAMTRY